MGNAQSSGAARQLNKEKSEPGPVINPDDWRKRGLTRSMTQSNLQASKMLWDEYRKVEAEAPKPVGGNKAEAEATGEAPKRASIARTRKMLDKASLRKMLSNVDDEIFVFLWRLFDSDGSGFVDADEFVVAMAMLSNDIGAESIDHMYATFSGTPRTASPVAPTSLASAATPFCGISTRVLSSNDGAVVRAIVRSRTAGSRRCSLCSTPTGRAISPSRRCKLAPNR